ncbi:NACHT domain-containing protein [Streptomyces sp. NBC_01186]|uniref:NACHT domain-containing protein n=1 Tax=unclassified Streptomyces TaxID=2593676 RepID=UPI002DD7C75C|nr:MULTISPECIES: NACHT domain-containing protein [unclassified Streptomyces]WSB77547.1 NACHT domain-containing protein [Streptomyces sp. NBC_01775]WSS14187.1 NACHT domain-containing protein [Streptomyces sp. NBC_01186]
MEPSTLAARLASSAVAPLVRKLFVAEGPGAGLVAEPVRISARLSFTGERRTLSERELRKLAEELVARSVHAAGPHEEADAVTRAELADALVTALHSLGDLDMDDVQAVRLGPEGLAARLATPRGLSEAAEARFRPLLHTACLHILHFFTQRSTFVARTVTEQARALDHLIAATDLLIERLPSRTAEDARFEERYAQHIARKHGELVIYGLDLHHGREWRLDSTYISLEATSLEAAQEAGPPLPADRALAGRERVLLRGGAGSGKTTLIQWLAVATARQEYDEHLAHLLGRVPFVLPLRRVVREGLPPTPDRFLHAVGSSLAGSQPPGWADRVLGAGRGLLLVDGVDELPEREREAVRRWLRELAADFPGNLWLVTARPSAVREDWLGPEGFAELSLAPMSRADAAAFIRRWHCAADADPGAAEALLAAIRSSGDLRRLAVNPLMCGLLCALNRERRGALPYGRRELYDAALSMLLERRDTERGIAAPDDLRLSKETRIQILQKLAHWLIRNDRAEMNRADAVAQVGRALAVMPQLRAEPETVFRHLLERSGLLNEPAEGRVAFVHRTFQDYLGAKAVVEEGDFPLLLDNARRAQWEDVVRMAVALGRPAERERILTGLTEPDESGEVGLEELVLAASCLEHAVEISPAVHERILTLTSRLLPPATRERARTVGRAGPVVLGLLPGPEDVSELTAEHAENIVITATRVATDAALPLLSRYAAHPGLGVRRQLAWAWRRFDTDAYAEQVISRLAETDLYFTAHTTAHLRALKALGGRARVQLVGEFDIGELTELLVPERLTHLWLTGPEPSDGAWLSAFPRLSTLVLPEDAPEHRPGTVPGHLTVVRGQLPG